MNDIIARVSRSLVSYLPSESLFGLRALRDVPDRVRRRPHEHDFAAFGIFDRPDCVVLDVGANRGQSIRSLRLFAPSATIHAFEPNPLLARHLERTQSSPDVVVHDHGLGAAAAKLPLFLPKYGNTVYDTRAALTADQAASFLSDDHFAFFTSSRADVLQSEVPIRPLDDLRLRPDAIKIDVEGADHDVVVGGWQTIEANRPLIMIEFPSEATCEALDGIGYEAVRLTAEGLRPGGSGELNTLFVQPAHSSKLERRLSSTP